MQINQNDQNEGEFGGGQARRPVVHAKVFEGEHRPPVVEGGLFQPRLAIQDWGNKVVPCQHFPGDLRVARLIRANQANHGPTQVRESVHSRERRS